MIIESIKIENFRGIEYLEIPALDEHINLFVGVNGAGKTSVLDSFSLVLSWLLARIRNPKSSGTLIAESDIKNNSKSGCSISIKVKNSGEWILYRSKSYAKNKTDNGKTELRDMMEYINEIHHSATQGGNIPVIMYYPVNRAINNAPAHLKRGGKEPEIWDTYENALKGNTEFRSFFEWYRKQEDNENEHIRDNRNYQDKKLSTIREAIKRFFPDFSDLRVRRTHYREKELCSLMKLICIYTLNGKWKLLINCVRFFLIVNSSCQAIHLMYFLTLLPTRFFYWIMAI